MHFYTEEGIAPAVQDVSFSIKKGKTFALVGESGCGKTVTSLAIMRSFGPPGKIVKGEIIFRNRDLLKLNDKKMRTSAGNKIAIIFRSL